MRNALVWIGAWGHLALCAGVHAEPMRDLVLEVEDPSSCIGSERLQAEVETRVGSLVFLDPSIAERRLQVRVRSVEPAGFEASVELRDLQNRPLGERELHARGADCAELERVLVLVISTLIGMAQPTAPRSDTRAREPRPEQGSREHPRPDTLPAKPPAPVPRVGPEVVGPERAAQPSRESVRFGLVLQAEAHSGLLPGIAPLGSVGLWARHDWFALQLGMVVAPQASRDLGEGARASFSGLSGDLEACGIAQPAFALELAFCGGAQAGVLRGHSEGLYENSTTVRPIARAILRASLHWQLLPEHALLLGVGGALPLVSQTYRFVERGEQPRLIHAVELGLLVQLGWLWVFAS